MFISPMLVQSDSTGLELSQETFTSKQHVAELLLDGIRCIVSFTDHKLHIYTKDGRNITHRFPELHNCPFPEGTIVDGELIVKDSQGRADYEAVAARIQSNKSLLPATFCAFDLIHYKGIDVSALSLAKRKEMLKEAFEDTESFQKVPYKVGKAEELFEQARAENLEGIIIKSKRAKYLAGKKTRTWIKKINWTYTEVYITGYRNQDYGLLASIDHTDGYSVPVGLIDQGVTEAHKNWLKRIPKRFIRKEDRHFTYLSPSLHASIRSRGWTRNGKLRSLSSWNLSMQNKKDCDHLKEEER
ncbi:ATP-dependent DNA ligase [Paenibacillus hexagrammi]|uniref:DNA ligase n=1 Tax=Paenibacillus hexagrammi TaxID=2908839 RepID=A0ABY3SRU1_9BACL|nr:RNA ligase family protein [Paenibacillus sp. YPD9-1]UJF35871.1 DNA ligase [Paenibacillus sp. YPD9-1]